MKATKIEYRPASEASPLGEFVPVEIPTKWTSPAESIAVAVTSWMESKGTPEAIKTVVYAKLDKEIEAGFGVGFPHHDGWVSGGSPYRGSDVSKLFVYAYQDRIPSRMVENYAGEPIYCLTSGDIFRIGYEERGPQGNGWKTSLVWLKTQELAELLYILLERCQAKYDYLDPTLWRELEAAVKKQLASFVGV